MNILQVLPFFTEKRGGSVVVPYHLAKALSKKGHNVTIITTDFEFDKNYAASLETYGVKIVPIKCVANIGLFLYSPDIKFWLETNLKDFDVIHMHNFRSYQNNVTYHYATKLGIPYLLQPHGTLPKIAEKKALKELYDLFWGRNLINAASRIIAISEEEEKYLQSLNTSSEKIELIYNGMETEVFNKLPEKGLFKNKYGIQDDFILFLGRLHKTKGIDVLIKAFSKISLDKQKLRLVIAGPDDGNYFELSSLVNRLGLSNRVIFTGFLSQSEKICAYRDALIFCHTVRYMGGVGITPLEALLCETPVIITEECGELIKKINSGYVINFDVAELSKTIEYVLNNYMEAKKKAEYGRSYIMNTLSWNSVIDKIEQIYEDCIHN